MVAIAYNYNNNACPAWVPVPIIATQMGFEDERTRRINNIPEHVKQQLRLNDINPDWIPDSLLEDIKQACIYDRTLNDNPDGHTTRDKLDGNKAKKKKKKVPQTFEEKLEMEREGRNAYDDDSIMLV